MEIIDLEFDSDRALYQSFMPFIKSGGLFYKTHSLVDIGTKVQMNVVLPDSLESSIVLGEVCWVTPAGSQSGIPTGFGIAFKEDEENVKNQIEKAIARLLNSSEPTLTM